MTEQAQRDGRHERPTRRRQRHPPYEQLASPAPATDVPSIAASSACGRGLNPNLNPNPNLEITS